MTGDQYPVTAMVAEFVGTSRHVIPKRSDGPLPLDCCAIAYEDPPRHSPGLSGVCKCGFVTQDKLRARYMTSSTRVEGSWTSFIAARGGCAPPSRAYDDAK